MQDILELERRITAAFDRLDRGVEALSQKPFSPEDEISAAPAPALAPLMRAMKSAQAAAADWADRYRALEAQKGADAMAFAAQIASLTEALSAAPSVPAPANTADLDDLAAQIADMEAKIAAQEAELATLRAARRDEAEELSEIIAALNPLIEEAAANA